jgi:transposase
VRKPIARIAEDLGISGRACGAGCTRPDIDDGRRDGSSSSDQAELAQLRRELRVAKMEVEILKRAAAFLAQENVLPT